MELGFSFHFRFNRWFINLMNSAIKRSNINNCNNRQALCFEHLSNNLEWTSLTWNVIQICAIIVPCISDWAITHCSLQIQSDGTTTTTKFIPLNNNPLMIWQIISHSFIRIIERVILNNVNQSIKLKFETRIWIDLIWLEF